jgi:hypothetical protein
MSCITGLRGCQLDGGDFSTHSLQMSTDGNGAGVTRYLQINYTTF